MKSIVRATLLLWVSLSAGISIVGANSTDCHKLVFNRYCLGGDASLLPASPGTQQLPGDGLHEFEETHQGKTVRLALDNGQLVTVVRYETPGGWLNFTAWKARLDRLYGSGKDLGHFPAYASSRSSRLNAINAGKGYAHMSWPQDGWSVELIWNHRDRIELRYQLDPPTLVPDNPEGL